MKAVRRVILFVLTLALVMSVIPTGFAGENDTYVLQRSQTLSTDAPNMQYSSASNVCYTYDGSSTYILPVLYNMRNKTNEEYLATYCLDIRTDALGGTQYRRLNLEDSSYSASVAGLIRAIVQKGFYVYRTAEMSDEDHAKAVRKKVADLGAAAHVTDLTLAEAISATQCAIWRATHGAILTFDDFVHNKYAYKSQTKSVKYADLCNEGLENYFEYVSYYNTFTEEQAETVNNKIRAVYNYLLSLEPVAFEKRTVSTASFTELHDPVFTENEDGTYNVTVTAEVDVDMSGDDTLSMTAALRVGGVDQISADNTFSLHDGTQTMTLTFSEVSANLYGQPVILSISGYQTGNGVYLYDAEGERGSSQTMVGMDNSRLPVYAEVVAQESHVLNITKTTYSGTPLEGIIFDIYPVATLDEYLNGSFTISNPTTRNDLAEYTLITDKNGFASLNFTQHGLKDGVYLVVEREHPDIVAPIDPFYIIFPARYTLGTESDYEISVYPKNELKNVPIPTGGIELLKVDSEDNTLMLSGAEFKVYRTASQEEIAANTEDLIQIPGISGSVLPVSFYDNQDKSGEKVTSVTTGADGKLSIYGLTFGDYYLVETKAPEGYNLMESPLEFTIDAGSHQGAPVLVENVSGAILPETGGIGTTVFTFGGMILVAFSVLMLLDRKRRHSM